MTKPRRSVAIARFEEIKDRRREILVIAAGLFAKRGFDGVSVREIADAAGIMGGSLYHHFASKKEIYLEVHSAALSHAADVVKAAYEDLKDPWERLEAAVAAHLELQLDPESLTLPLMSDLSSMTGEMRVEIVRQRDDFEMIYRRLISVLPLRPDVDREIYRLSLVSLINTVPVWYRMGRLSPEAIATQITQIFRSAKADPQAASPHGQTGAANAASAARKRARMA
ncbi:MAG TPA: TetR/AcrR family transcriptional regulator [Caulobacteraceae bacterium]|nr:TetR/AcrR family transcriptional regulator [Caulobacteraceae bacterium]